MKHKHDNKTIDIEDVIVWGDSDVHPTWCYRYELDQYSHMSDDYSVVSFGTKEYDEFFNKNTEGL